MRTPRAVEVVRQFFTGVAVGTGPGVVAVSGGADSVALVRALLDAGCGPLTVAHVNHLLRGEDSDADEAFVRDLAGTLGVGFRSVRVDVAAAGGNLEATARRVRYDWFARVAAEAGAAWVATGHTADDQAETVLHRLVRGTGLQGLRGIASAGVRSQESGVRAGRMVSSSSPPFLGERPGEGLRREEPNPPTPFPEKEGGASTGPGAGVAVLRPLLAVTRADILAYLASLGQPYRTDASNADPRFTRNRIRAELLPLLKTFNPDVVAALGRLAEQAAEAHDVVAEQARALLARAELPRAAGVVILDAPILAAAPPAVVRAALRLVWEREGWPAGDMRADHWGRADAVVRGVTTASDFPGGATARRRGRVVQIEQRS